MQQQKVIAYLLLFSFTFSCLNSKKRIQGTQNDDLDDSSLQLVDESTIAALSAVPAGAVAIAILLRLTQYPLSKAQLKTNPGLEEFQKLSAERKLQEIGKLIEVFTEARKLAGQSGPINIAIIGASGGSGHRNGKDGMIKALEYASGDKFKSLFNIQYIEPLPFKMDQWNKAQKAKDGEALKKLIERRPLAEIVMDLPMVRKHMQTKILETMGTTPDILIQGEHIGTGLFQSMAKNLGAQHILVTTDFNVAHFLGGVSKKKLADLRVHGNFKGPNAEFLKTTKLDGLSFVGYPVRWEFFELSQLLRSSDPEKRAKGQKKVEESINRLAEGSFDFTKDRSILYMMGGNGSSKETLVDLVNTFAENGSKLAPADGKVHLFIAGSEGIISPQEVKNAFRNGSQPVIVHTLGQVKAMDVASFMGFHNGITLTKAGGGTAAELMTMAGTPIFDPELSQYIGWEKDHYEYFDKEKWGTVLDPTATGEKKKADLIEKCAKAFEMRSEAIRGMPRNEFHLDWPKALLEEMITHEYQRVLKDPTRSIAGRKILELDPTRGAGAIRQFDAIQEKINQRNNKAKAVSRGFVAIGLLSAVSTAIIAVAESSADSTPAVALGSCALLIEGQTVCIYQENPKHQSLETQEAYCNEIPGAKWFADASCGNQKFSESCSLGGEKFISFNRFEEIPTEDLCQRVREAS